jgi:hypothetical protein
LGDIKSYAKEIETLEGALNKALEIEDEGDRNSRVKLVNNQIEESTLALQVRAQVSCRFTPHQSMPRPRAQTHKLLIIVLFLGLCVSLDGRQD